MLDVGKLINNKELVKKINLLMEFRIYSEVNDIEEATMHENEIFTNEAEAKKFFGIYGKVVYIFSQEYYRHELFITDLYIYDLFFYHLKTNQNSSAKKEPEEIIKAVFYDINNYRIINNSLIVHPLADFGFQSVGAKMYFLRTHDYVYESNDYLIFPQANSLEKAIANIRYAMKKFRLSSCKLEVDLIEHYQRSRNTRWLISNPLLIHKIRQSYEGYYSNRFFIVKQLEKHISLLFLTKCVSEAGKLQKDTLFSTRRVNNLQTYDQYHYFIVRKDATKATVECVPRQQKLSRIFDTFRLRIDLPVNISAQERKDLDCIDSFLKTIYLSQYSGNPAAMYNQIRRSVGYFVRSYQAEYSADKILFLCIAFEMLYGEGSKENISAHISNIILFLMDGDEESVKAFKNLYNARSGVAHEGSSDRECDLVSCRYLYFNLLLRLSRFRTGQINFNQDDCFSQFMNARLQKKLGFSVDIK